MFYLLFKKNTLFSFKNICKKPNTIYIVQYKLNLYIYHKLINQYNEIARN